jgi:hypothetical protein
MTTMKKLGLALAMLVTLGLGACGDDDGGGAEGDGSSGGGGSGSGSAPRAGSGSSSTGNTADDIAMCMMMGTTGSPDCEGIDEYTTCVMEACEEEYETCLGPNYLQGDFSGGMCESLAECTETAADPCMCDADSECVNCFVDNLVSCAMTCPLPNCGGGGGTAGSGGLPSSDKTCDDFKDCCDSLDGQAMTSCLAQYDGIKAAGDAACGIAYSTLGTALGCD